MRSVYQPLTPNPISDSLSSLCSRRRSIPLAIQAMALAPLLPVLTEEFLEAFVDASPAATLRTSFLYFSF